MADSIEEVLEERREDQRHAVRGQLVHTAYGVRVPTEPREEGVTVEELDEGRRAMHHVLADPLEEQEADRPPEPLSLFGEGVGSGVR